MLHHNADLVLALCWDHACWNGMPPSSDVSDSPAKRAAPDFGPHPFPVYETVHLLASALARDPIDLEDLASISRELVQRFEDEGFEWKVAASGSAYERAIERDFDTFGHVAPSQPVKTLHAALFRNGVLKKRGLVQRIRPSEGN
jgi:hypothetical protein